MTNISKSQFPTSSSATLRDAQVEDKPAMLSVMSPYRNRHFPGGLDKRRTRVAEIDGEVVGFIGWKENEVLALYVTEAWRGQKLVGPLLLAAAETAIREAGYERIRIMIDPDASGAHRFYQKNDYITVWDRCDEDIAWMTKDI